MSSTTQTEETTKTGEIGKTPKKASASQAAKSPKTAKAVAESPATPATGAGKAPKAATAAKAVKEGVTTKAAKAPKSAKADAPAPACPCGSGESLPECCGPILAGTSPALTAEALMRSRYTAYALGDIAHLRSSLDTRWQKDFDEQASLEWSRNAQWQGLTIVETKDGGPADDEGTVEFIAAFHMDGQDQKIRERAQFKKRDGAWFYVDGKVKSTQETVVSGPKVGRNDPCPCGSGKKFKKCCG